MNFPEMLSLCYSQKKMVISHNDEELEFLSRWLNNKFIDAVEPVECGLSVSEMIESCSFCKDIKERKQAYGSGKNHVMIILNAPKFMDILEKNRLRNESIELMKKIIDVIKLKINECYITNLVKCETSSPENFSIGETMPCLDIFTHELDLINPRIVLVMGEISSLQKIIRGNPAISWFNIDHPMTLLKNAEFKKPAWNTLKLVMKKIAEK